MNMIEFVQFLSSNLWIYGGTFLLVLSILVFVHEWGHYIIARICGIRVESFSIGFGKELIGYDDKHGTRWKLSLVPLGGYVKLYGDVDPASAEHTDVVKDDQGQERTMTDEEKKQAFFSKPVWKRAAVVFAGPAINYIFAIILLAGLFVSNGQPVTPPKAAAIVKGSAAEEYGLQPQDMIVSIGGKSIYSFEDIRREMMIGLDVEKQFIIERDGQTQELAVKPKKVEVEDRFGFKHSRGVLGLISPRNAIRVDSIVQIGDMTYTKDQAGEKKAALAERLGTTFTIQIVNGSRDEFLIVTPDAANNPYLLETTIPGKDSKNAADEVASSNILFLADADDQAFLEHSITSGIKEAVNQTYIITVGTLEAIGQMITGTRSATELGGIIRIGAVAGDMAQQGIIALIMFTALLSINLGLINLFPIPMLDGGHLVFYAFEAILGKPIPERIQEYAFRLGLAFLVGIMVFANLNDVISLLM